MINQTLLIFLFTGLVNLTFSQTLKTFRGTVDYKFHLSGTNAIKPAERRAWECEIDPYLKKMNLLTSYYNALNRGEVKAAEKILSKDTLLSKDNSFTLAYMFTMARMKTLGILYKPCVQVNDKSAPANIIVCTNKQQKEFIKHANSKQYELQCEYIGSMIKDNIQVYKLNSYK